MCSKDGEVRASTKGIQTPGNLEVHRAQDLDNSLVAVQTSRSTSRFTTLKNMIMK